MERKVTNKLNSCKFYQMQEDFLKMNLENKKKQNRVMEQI